jgi:hypothetical protein
MFKHGDRKITVEKSELLVTIKQNQKNHIKVYKKAVAAYKVEAKKQLENQLVDLKNGSIKIGLKLITPIDNQKNYDSVIEMFKWDINKTVELTQSEFKEYVQDKTDHSLRANIANTAYFNS